MAQPVAPGLAYLRLAIVNVAYLGPQDAGDRGWVLADAGLRGTAWRIERAAAQRFGAGARPVAIVMTHGHFDHVYALDTLARKWDVPVYVHPLDMSYLNGTCFYPTGDASVGGGRPFYSTDPVDMGYVLQPLPESGEVPRVPGWLWMPTPSHSPGHVSL